MKVLKFLGIQWGELSKFYLIGDLADDGLERLSKWRLFCELEFLENGRSPILFAFFFETILIVTPSKEWRWKNGGRFWGFWFSLTPRTVLGLIETILKNSIWSARDSTLR